MKKANGMGTVMGKCALEVKEAIGSQAHARRA